MKLAELRQQIDLIDQEILKLLSKRFKVVKKIGEYKKKNKLPVLDSKREEELIAELKKQAQLLQLKPYFIEKLFKLILEESKKLQKDG